MYRVCRWLRADLKASFWFTSYISDFLLTHSIPSCAHVENDFEELRLGDVTEDRKSTTQCTIAVIELDCVAWIRGIEPSATNEKPCSSRAAEIRISYRNVGKECDDGWWVSYRLICRFRILLLLNKHTRSSRILTLITEISSSKNLCSGHRSLINWNRNDEIGGITNNSRINLICSYSPLRLLAKGRICYRFLSSLWFFLRSRQSWQRGRASQWIGCEYYCIVES